MSYNKNMDTTLGRDIVVKFMVSVGIMFYVDVVRKIRFSSLVLRNLDQVATLAVSAMCILMIVGIVWALLFLPPDYQQSFTTRILVIHVAVAGTSSHFSL